MGFCHGGKWDIKGWSFTDFQVHQIEHQLGAYTDCNHGQGLAVIQPVYYKHILNDAREKLTRIAKEVFNVDSTENGIFELEQLIKECGLPSRLGKLKSKIEITGEVLREVANSTNIVKYGPRQLSHEEIFEILCECK